MKLNQLPNLRVEDFTSEKSWIGRLFIQLNPLFQNINQVLDQNIDFATNIKSVTKEYAISSVFQSFSFLWPFTGFTPIDVRIIQATKTSQKTPTILLPCWKFNSETNSITITNILEVTDSGTFVLNGIYNFTIRATI